MEPGRDPPSQCKDGDLISPYAGEFVRRAFFRAAYQGIFEIRHEPESEHNRNEPELRTCKRSGHGSDLVIRNISVRGLQASRSVTDIDKLTFPSRFNQAYGVLGAP